jgi:putative transposase
MPRMARRKTNDSIFHVMCRSISEVDLFKNDDDKTRYMNLIKKYQKVYEFKVLGYCLMDNHAHLLIDVNGADISSIMHSINFSYAQYFNKVHKRHGHLFQDRFRSKIITDDRYLFAVSAYIHTNPMDIEKFKNCPEKYKFSSLSIYLGLRSDPYNLVCSNFVLSLFGNNPKSARERYIKFVYKCSDTKLWRDVEFEGEETEYRSCRTILARNQSVDEIIDYIALKMNISKIKLHMKNSKAIVEAKALLVLLMRCVCNFKCSDICRTLGNITQSRVSKLCSIASELIDKEEKYRGIVGEFIKPKVAI